jgi:hypothetical protein
MALLPPVAAVAERRSPAFTAQRQKQPSQAKINADPDQPNFRPPSYSASHSPSYLKHPSDRLSDHRRLLAYTMCCENKSRIDIRV